MAESTKWKREKWGNGARSLGNEQLTPSQAWTAVHSEKQSRARRAASKAAMTTVFQQECGGDLPTATHNSQTTTRGRLEVGSNQ